MSRISPLTFLITLSVLAVTTSCEHKEIVCPTSENLNVVFEWDKASNADVDGMTLFFYPLEENERIWRFDIAGRDGGNVNLPSGKYELIACNNDLPGIILEDTESASTLHASVRNLAIGHDTEVYSNSGMLYCAEIRKLEITPCGVRYLLPNGTYKECPRGIVRCQPDSIATVFNVKLTNISGMQYIHSATVALENVRASIALESDLPSEIPATLAIDMTVNPKDDTLSGCGCAFAPSDLKSADFRLRLQVVLTNGKSIARDIEITPENLNIITGHNVLIAVDGIVIPDDSSSGDIGGIGAIVDGWEVVIIDLEPTFQ